MRPRDLQTLELPKLLDALASLAASSTGADRCRALLPATDLDEVDRRLTALREYLYLSADHPQAPAMDLPDVRAHLGLAVHDGAVLEASDLAMLLSMLRLAAALHRYLRRAAPEAVELATLAGLLEYPQELERALARAIDESGRIRDDATPELASLRVSLRALRADLETRLVQLLADAGPDVAAEQYVTLRNDRFVVPVRTGAAQRIAGVIQDRSASGETIFLEPLFAVECNNQLVLTRKAEEAEERRVCRQLTQEVGHQQERLATTFEALVECDVLAARAALARRLDATVPTMGADEIRLRGARHPLLVLGDRPAVPVDLLLPAKCRGLVITGPNTGGKTVALKTIGLLGLMAQCGLAVPAEDGSALPCFTGIYADIGDSQSIERNLSTFSSHMENLAQITAEAGCSSLVLLDEPGVGTDPAEGAALAVGLLGYARDCGAFVAASSHAADVKTFALGEAGFDVAAVDIDPETGEPRYQLHYQALGQSLALPMARRMGLPEPILAAAARQLSGAGGPDVARATERLEAMRSVYQKKLTELDQERAALAARQAEHTALVAELTAKQRTAWRDAVAEAREFVRELRADGRRALDELRRHGTAKMFQKTIAETDAAVTAASARHAAPSDGTDTTPAIGDEVEVVDQHIRGELVEISGERARIRRGALRFEVPATALRRVGPGGRRPERRSGGSHRSLSMHVADVPAVATEISLLGMRTRDAIAELDTFMDRAVRSGAISVRVIHGIGTGALRRAVQDYLTVSGYCTSFREGGPAEGGVGVTVVELDV